MTAIESGPGSVARFGPRSVAFVVVNEPPPRQSERSVRSELCSTCVARWTEIPSLRAAAGRDSGLPFRPARSASSLPPRLGSEPRQPRNRSTSLRSVRSYARRFGTPCWHSRRK